MDSTDLILKVDAKKIAKKNGVKAPFNIFCISIIFTFLRGLKLLSRVCLRDCIDYLIGSV